MKKTAIVLTIFFLFSIAMPLFAAIDSAKLIYVKGDVIIQTKDTGDSRKGKVGDSIHAGDILKTNKKSTVEIAFDEKIGNIVKIDEYSIFSIQSFNPVKVSIVKGRVFSIIDNLDKGSTFEVRTPQAVAGARGTGWSMAIEGGKTDIEGYEHTIYAAGLAKDGSILGQIDIPAGFKSSVDEFNPPSALEKLSKGQINKWNKIKSGIEKHKRTFLNPNEQSGGEEDFEDAEERFQIMEDGREARFEAIHESRSEAVEQRSESRMDNDNENDARRGW
ncbi:MAG: FecR family protein [Candidatus Omnitrophota bacterium]